MEYCWRFRNPAIQLSLVVSPILYKDCYIPGDRRIPDHQQYGKQTCREKTTWKFSELFSQLDTHYLSIHLHFWVQHVNYPRCICHSSLGDACSMLGKSKHIFSQMVVWWLFITLNKSKQLEHVWWQRFAYCVQVLFFWWFGVSPCPCLYSWDLIIVTYWHKNRDLIHPLFGKYWSYGAPRN